MIGTNQKDLTNMPRPAHRPEKADCYKCKFRREIPGDAHSSCANKNAEVSANSYGIKSGWFMWPFNFDPVWLISCNGFKKKATP